MNLLSFLVGRGGSFEATSTPARTCCPDDARPCFDAADASGSATRSPTFRRSRHPPEPRLDARLVPASAASLRPRILQRHRPVEHRRARLRVDAVGDEVAVALELE